VTDGSSTLVVDWLADRTIWSMPSIPDQLEFLSQPAGGAFAIGAAGATACIPVATPPNTLACPRSAARITVVNRDGSAKVLPADYVTLW